MEQEREGEGIKGNVKMMSEGGTERERRQRKGRRGKDKRRGGMVSQ